MHACMHIHRQSHSQFWCPAFVSRRHHTYIHTHIHTYTGLTSSTLMPSFCVSSPLYIHTYTHTCIHTQDSHPQFWCPAFVSRRHYHLWVLAHVHLTRAQSDGCSFPMCVYIYMCVYHLWVLAHVHLTRAQSDGCSFPACVCVYVCVCVCVCVRVCMSIHAWINTRVHIWNIYTYLRAYDNEVMLLFDNYTCIHTYIPEILW
jgi:hypothetical protein